MEDKTQFNKTLVVIFGVSILLTILLSIIIGMYIGNKMANDTKTDVLATIADIEANNEGTDELLAKINSINADLEALKESNGNIDVNRINSIQNELDDLYNIVREDNRYLNAKLDDLKSVVEELKNRPTTIIEVVAPY